MKSKKIYIQSGELSVVLMASSPMDAIKRALDNHGAGKKLGTVIYLDERGFREDSAKYKVPVEQVLTDLRD